MIKKIVLRVLLISFLTGFSQKEFDHSHSQWNTLLSKYVSNTGNVDYQGFKSSQNQLKSYLEALANHVPDKSWSKSQSLAYWINAYNAFTVELIIKKYPIKSIKDIGSPWDKKFIKLGKHTLSLNDIEHKILRKKGEPRIHFAINCASVSCPNLLNEAFVSDRLEKQLTMTTKAFLADQSKNIITSDKIEISKIFDWFSDDFKSKGSIIDFINTYSEIKVNRKAKKKYMNYSWSLNE